MQTISECVFVVTLAKQIWMNTPDLMTSFNDRSPTLFTICFYLDRSPTLFKLTSKILSDIKSNVTSRVDLDHDIRAPKRLHLLLVCWYEAHPVGMSVPHSYQK